MNHLRYAGSPEGTRWLRGPGGTKNLERPPLRSCRRRRERKLDRPRVVQKSDHVYSILRRTRADFPKPPQPIVALVPKVDSLWEHRVAVAVIPLRAWNASVARRQKTLTAVPGKLPLCRTNAYPAVKAVVLAVLVRSAGPITQNVGARELEFPAPRMVRRTPPTASCIAPRRLHLAPGPTGGR